MGKEPLGHDIWVTTFAALYVAFYARFASQWAYLASVYNQVKSSEARAAEKTPAGEREHIIAQWKAAFIEDAEVLHLHRKGIFVGTVRAWGANDDVRACFVASTYGGEERLRMIMQDVEDSY